MVIIKQIRRSHYYLRKDVAIITKKEEEPFFRKIEKGASVIHAK